MKKTLLLLGLIIGLISTIHSQVTSVDYQIKYNESFCEYDAYVVINAGTATTIPQRIQFNAQYSIVVPTGTNLTITESYMPLQSNATYTGTIPLTWSAGTPVVSPAAQPESDFYSITPDLGITSHYNDLAAGDAIKIFSFAVDTIFNCSEGIRIFENGVDPDSDQPGMGMADFSNGFLLGSINQIYNGNSTQIYPPEPEIVSITNSCSNGLEIDLTAETSACQEPLSFSWTGPDGYSGTTEDVNITPALPENNGVYKVVITDAFGCKDSISIDATSKPNAGPDYSVCAGSTTTLYGTMPSTGTWAQVSSNPFGASLIPLAGGVVEVTFSTSVAGTYGMVYSIPGCSDTMQFTVNPLSLVNIAASEICENAMTTASSNIPGGSWVSNDATVATIDPNTGVITGQASGTTTFTYTSPSGCTSETNLLTVNPGPAVTVTGASTICVGGTTFVSPTSGGTWSSSDNSVATVTNAGVVEGVGVGNTTLTFTDTTTGCTSDGITIEVNALPVAIITGSDSICVSGTTTLIPNTDGTWASSNSIVATIDNSGNVTAHAVGTAVFTFTYLNSGCTSQPSDTLWVLEIPEITFTGEDTLCIGETSSISSNEVGTWVSSNSGVATIDVNTGEITAIADGTATFTFTNTMTSCVSEASTPLIVHPVPTVSITGLDQICVGETTQLFPSSGGTWVCSDHSIVSIDNSGLATAISAGGPVTCTWTDNLTGCTSDASAPIFVNPAPETTVMDDELCIGETSQLFPSSGGTWVSADPSIVTVTAGGLVQGVSAGTTTFTFTSSTTGCNSEPTDPITVHGYVSTVITGDEVICIGKTTQMSPSTGGTWVSSDNSVLTITNSGIVTGVAAGKATLTFTPSATGCPSLPSDSVEVIFCLGPETACDQIAAENIYCDFDEFGNVEGTLPFHNFTGNQPSGILCDDGDEVQNITWYGFVALEGEYDIVINTTNCNPNTATFSGAEIGIYSNCSFNEQSKLYCEKGTEVENQARIPSSLLIPGQTYFLYIDGYGGSVCDYSIEVDGSYDNTYCTDLSKVTGVAYIDENENGAYEEGETLLRNALISLSPGNFSVLTNEEGRYVINTPKGGATLTAKMNEGNWVNDELTIEDLTIFEDCVEGVNFGFIPNVFLQEAKLSVANTVTRCDWETRFYFTVENTGTIDIDANFEFDYDSKATYFATNLAGIQVNGNTASGELGIIKPFEVKEYWIKLKMPSGSTVLPMLDFKTTLYNEAGMELDAYEQSEQLRCSYDPNDKREFPNREGEDNLTLMDEDLEYTIRFQNNGNDTAFQVKIIDPLDPNIDKTSIRIINSSHPVETCIENDNLIFLFENINLVDSMTNYDASQGYVSFRCNAKEGRPENTIIHNTADIIFDTNIPIVTNTTINTLVSELCTDITTEVDIEICEGEDYNGLIESGIYTEIYPLTFGCDSTVIINLDVQGITYSSQDMEICEGESFELNGEEYTLYESQVINDTMYNAIGCLSNIFEIDVHVNPVVLIDIDTMICEGLDYNGLTESGIYTIDSFDAVTGCDIITTVDLEVLPMSDPSCLVGTDDLTIQEIKIYPNPVSDVLYLEGDVQIEAVSIYSMEYQKLKEVTFKNRGSKQQISTLDLSIGLYIIEVKSGNLLAYKKLIVE